MSKPCIVVIDDDPMIVALVELRLGMAGYVVESATGGAAGLTLVGRLRPALVILDWRMPDMDGVEVLKRLKKDRATASVPVMMLTAQNRPQDVRAALDFGASGYMVKPFKPDDLVARVEKMVRQSGVVWMD